MLSSWNHLRCFKLPLPRLSFTWQICGISPLNFNNQSSQLLKNISKPEIYAVSLSLIKWLNTTLYIMLVPIEIWLLLLLFYVLTSAASPRCVWDKRQKQHEVSDLNRDYILRAEFQINVCSHRIGFTFRMNECCRLLHKLKWQNTMKTTVSLFITRNWEKR